jgi:hypothetical protein
MVGLGMHPRVAQFLAAIVVLSAAWLMPSLASAHAGHAHHAAAATEMKVAPAAEPADTAPAVSRTEIARAATIAVIESAAKGGGDGCASHCCGAFAGMTCCGAALAAEVVIGPVLAGSQKLSFEHASALLGQPPEALPKPPKPFA